MSAPIQTLQANIAAVADKLKSALVWTTNTGRLYISEASGTQYPINGYERHERTFTEVTGDGAASTYVATVTVPAGYSCMDIAVGSTVVWDATTTATMVIGDADSSTGYVASLDLKTSPAANTSGAYGLRIPDLNGTYKYGKYYASAGLITITVTVNDNGSHHAGRTRVNVILAPGARTVVAATHTA